MKQKIKNFFQEFWSPIILSLNGPNLCLVFFFSTVEFRVLGKKKSIIIYFYIYCSVYGHILYVYHYINWWDGPAEFKTRFTGLPTSRRPSPPNALIWRFLQVFFFFLTTIQDKITIFNKLDGEVRQFVVE